MTPLTQAKILKVERKETLPERRLRHNLPHLAITLSIENFLALTACAGTSEITNDLKEIKIVIPQPITASLEALATPTRQKKTHTEPLRTPVTSTSRVTLEDGEMINLTGVNTSPSPEPPPKTPVTSSSHVTLDNRSDVIELTGVDTSSSKSSPRLTTHKRRCVEPETLILEVIDLTGDD